MHQKHSYIYKILDVYGIRTPSLTLGLWNTFFSQEVVTHENFKSLLDNPILREGIYLASPELFTQILNWQKGFLKCNTYKLQTPSNYSMSSILITFIME